MSGIPATVIPLALAMSGLEPLNHRREELEMMTFAPAMVAVRVSFSTRKYTIRPASTGLAHKVIHQLPT
jgi:hypothetical protein